jgi:hypothetical protein
VNQLLAPHGANVVEVIAETGSESTGTEDELGFENPFPNPFNTIERTQGDFVANESEISYVLKGIFGLGNLGQGGPIAASKSKIGIEYGNNERRAIATGATRNAEVLEWKTGKSIGIGGGTTNALSVCRLQPSASNWD